MNSYQFFLRNQSGTPTPQERIRIARALSDAERKARDMGISFMWYSDDAYDWYCTATNLNGNEIARSDIVGFASDAPCNPGKRITESELALQILAEGKL